LWRAFLFLSPLLWTGVRGEVAEVVEPCKSQIRLSPSYTELLSNKILSPAFLSVFNLAVMENELK